MKSVEEKRDAELQPGDLLLRVVGTKQDDTMLVIGSDQFNVVFVLRQK